MMDWLAQQVAPIPLPLFLTLAVLTVAVTAIACLPHKWVEQIVRTIGRKLGKR